MSDYFISGATGSVGSAVVPLLLDSADSQVRLLLRAQSDAALKERLDGLLKFWGFENDEAKKARIKAYRGDVARPRFGLEDSAYAELLEHSTHAIHCAGTVRMNLSIEEARHSAVDAARAMIDFCRELAANNQLKKFEYVSTLGVAGKRPGILPERWLDEPRLYHNTYEQAKSEAEVVVREAVESHGLPVTTHRPSMIIGDSRNGRIIHFQIFYFICEFLSGRRTYGLFPDFGKAQLDVIPVDWVAAAIVASSGTETSVGRVFHLCSGPDSAPTLEQLKEVVRASFRSHGVKVPPGLSLPRNVFSMLAKVATLAAPEAKRRSLSTLPIYLDYLADQQGFGNTDSLTWFDRLGLSLPAPSSYLNTVLDYYIESRYGTPQSQ